MNLFPFKASIPGKSVSDLLESMKYLQKKPNTALTPPTLSPTKESKTERCIRELKCTLEQGRTARISSDQALPFSQSKSRTKRLEETKVKKSPCESDRRRKSQGDLDQLKGLACDKMLDTENTKRDECLTMKSVDQFKIKTPDSETKDIKSNGEVKLCETASEKERTAIPADLSAQNFETDISDKKNVDCSIANIQDSGIDTFKQLESFLDHEDRSGDCENSSTTSKKSFSPCNNVDNGTRTKSKECSTELIGKKVTPNEADLSLSSPKTTENFEVFYKRICQKLETKKPTSLEISPDSAVKQAAKKTTNEEFMAKLSNQHQSKTSPKSTPMKSLVPSPKKPKEVQVIPPHKEIEIKIEDMKREDLVTEILEKDGNAIIRITPRQSFEDALQPFGGVNETSKQKESTQDKIPETREWEKNLVLPELTDNLLVETPRTQKNSPRSDIRNTRKLSPVCEEELNLDTTSERSVSEHTSNESYCDPFNQKLVDRITTISRTLGPCLSNEKQNVPPKSDNIYDKVTQGGAISYFVTTTSSDMTLKAPEKQLERKSSSDFKFKGRSVEETECVLDSLSKQLSQLRNQSQKREYFRLCVLKYWHIVVVFL